MKNSIELPMFEMEYLYNGYYISLHYRYDSEYRPLYESAVRPESDINDFMFVYKVSDMETREDALKAAEAYVLYENHKETDKKRDRSEYKKHVTNFYCSDWQIQE